MNFLKSPDERVHIFFSTFLLLVVGFIFIYSVGSMQAARLGKTELYFFYKQLAAAVSGFIMMYAATRIPLEAYRKYVVGIYFFTMILLMAVFLFPKVNGSYRWIPLPIFSFQPSELAKFTTVLYLAHYLDKKDEKIRSFSKGLIPAGIMLGLLASLILSETDFGTTVLLMIVAICLFMIGGANIKHLFGGIAFIAPLMISFMFMGYRKIRMISFLDPWEYRDNAGYQLIQSLVAIGSGGIYGKGLGNSSQKLYFLPEAHTDFIFSIIAEEFGIVGSIFVLGIVLYLFYMCIRVAAAHKDRYKRMLTLGIALMLIFQCLIHVGVTSGVFPTKGITFPLLSYGGTALLFQLFMVGIILRSAEEAK